jgi:hypothetical protein
MLKTKATATLLLTPLLILAILAATPANAQPYGAGWIQNNKIRITYGYGSSGSPFTIVGISPVSNLNKNIVWLGEYEYLALGPPGPHGYSAPNLVRLFGPGATRTFLGNGGTWYAFSIAVSVGSVPVLVTKTVTIPTSSNWVAGGWAQITYNIQTANPSSLNNMYLYYYIDYTGQLVTGSSCNNMWFGTGAVPWHEALWSACPPMPTPPGGFIGLDTKGIGWGFLDSSSWAPGVSTFPVIGYLGSYYQALSGTWSPNVTPLHECNDGGALDVDLGTITNAGTVCNQIIIAAMFSDPPQTLGSEEPPVPPVGLVAGLSTTPAVQIIEYLNDTHDVAATCGVVDQAITFDGESSFDQNGTITQWSWNFGDGASSNEGPTVSHAYAQSGIYNVTLTLTDNNSMTSDAVATFLVPSVSVGGIVVPVDKLGLLAPYIGLASTILVGTVASVVYVKRVKHRKEKR